MNVGCSVVCHPLGQIRRGRVNAPRGERYTPPFHNADRLLDTLVRLALNVRAIATRALISTPAHAA